MLGNLNSTINKDLHPPYIQIYVQVCNRPKYLALNAVTGARITQSNTVAGLKGNLKKFFES